MLYVMTPQSLVDMYKRVGGAYFLNVQGTCSTLKTERVRSSETLVHSYQTIRQHIPEECEPTQHARDRATGLSETALLVPAF